jgi:hypothetical protein
MKKFEYKGEMYLRFRNKLQGYSGCGHLCSLRHADTCIGANCGGSGHYLIEDTPEVLREHIALLAKHRLGVKL